MTRIPSRDWVGGAVLIIVGGFFLARNLVPGIERLIPLFVGLALLALFFLIRSPGALIPGGIVTGVGVGILVASQGNTFGGAGFLMSVGAGFIAISVLGAIFGVPGTRYWPLVPGSVLIAIGAVIFAAQLGPQVLELAETYWPLVLIVVGGYLLLRARQGVGAIAEDRERLRSHSEGSERGTRVTAAVDRPDRALGDDERARLGRLGGEARQRDEERPTGEQGPLPLDRV